MSITRNLNELVALEQYRRTHRLKGMLLLAKYAQSLKATIPAQPLFATDLECADDQGRYTGPLPSYACANFLRRLEMEIEAQRAGREQRHHLEE